MSSALLQESLPSRWYKDEAIFRIEKERIFCREWMAVGRVEELPQAGDYKVLDVMGESILLLRNRSGGLRGFYNVCRHRGARLCRPPGESLGHDRVALGGGMAAGRMIVCPYHQWSYDLDGALIAAPQLTGERNFDRGAFHLYPVGVECWGGFVFLNLTPATAQPLLTQLDGIPHRLRRYPLEELRIGASIEYEVQANWKILAENYNECYHCGGVHPELCAVVPAFRERGGADLDWSRGVPHRDGAYTFTRSGTTTRRAFPTLDADERVRHKGELIYPVLWVSLACDHAAIFILRPRSATCTAITCQFLFEPHEMAKPNFDPADAVDFWHLVNRQDWSVCEAVQQGIDARVHHHGYYAPMEDWNLDIRRYVTERVGDAVSGEPKPSPPTPV